MAATTAIRLVPPPGETQNRIASSVKALADIMGVLHTDLAARADIDADKLSKSLSMRRRLTLEETQRLADALGVPVPVLYEGGAELRRRACAAVLDANSTSPDGPDGLEISHRAWNGDNLVDMEARRNRPSVTHRQAA